jgi:hypothetical protein
MGRIQPFEHSFSNQMPEDSVSFEADHKIQYQGTPPPRKFKPPREHNSYQGGVAPAWLNKAREMPLSDYQIQAIKTNIFTVARKG